MFGCERWIRSVAAGAVMACAAMGAANAGFVPYFSRAAFDAAGTVTSVDWGAFGPAGTGISTPDFRMFGALKVWVSSSQGELVRHDEGTDFTGDFARGDHLLTDAGSQSDTFIISFATLVRGFGAQIESDALSGPWTGSIDLFDASDNLLDTIVIGGTRGTAEDGSAPFFGVLSDTANISYAYFWVNNPDVWPYKSGSLAINTLDVITAAPEPPAIALASGGVLLLAGWRRRRRAKAS